MGRPTRPRKALTTSFLSSFVFILAFHVTRAPYDNEIKQLLKNAKTFKLKEFTRSAIDKGYNHLMKGWNNPPGINPSHISAQKKEFEEARKYLIKFLDAVFPDGARCARRCNSLYGECTELTYTTLRTPERYSLGYICECFFSTVSGPVCDEFQSGFAGPLSSRTIKMNPKINYWEVLGVRMNESRVDQLLAAYQKKGQMYVKDKDKFSLVVEAYNNLLKNRLSYERLYFENLVETENDVSDFDAGIGCRSHRDCKHGGLCVRDKDKRKICNCREGFQGVHCEHETSCFELVRNGLERKRKDICENGGVCKELRTKKLRTVSKCWCPFGTTGRLCTERDNQDLQLAGLCSDHGELRVEPKTEYKFCDCHPGWQSRTCNQKCDENFYGKDCLNHCLGRHFCRLSEICDPVSGQCPDGCDPGWMGDSCSVADQLFVITTFRLLKLNNDDVDQELLSDVTEYKKEKDSIKRFALERLMQRILEEELSIPETQQEARKAELLSRHVRQTNSNTTLPNAGLKSSNSQELQSMDDSTLQKAGLAAGLRLNQVKLANLKQGVDVRFQVSYAREFARQVSLQEMVKDVIVEGAGDYRSTLGAGYRISKASVAVTQPEVVPTAESDPPSYHGTLMILGAVVIPVVVVAICSVLWLVLHAELRTGSHQTNRCFQNTYRLQTHRGAHSKRT